MEEHEEVDGVVGDVCGWRPETGPKTFRDRAGQVVRRYVRLKKRTHAVILVFIVFSLGHEGAGIADWAFVVLAYLCEPDR